jgi:acyl-coenzyme A synthetase/AMP-(fatty) acid ligase
MTKAPSAAAFPLIRHDHRDSIIAYRDGAAITAATFLADVSALAEKLPERTYVVNRAGDRYYFAVGFAAALVRGQITLLPSNDTAQTLRQLTTQYHDVYCLTEEAIPGIAMEQFLYSAHRPASSVPFAVPVIEAQQIAALIFTSGSTGQPVAQPRSWGALVRSARCAGASIGVKQLPGAAIVSTVSPQHSYGLESSIMLALQYGLSLTTSRTFYPADILHQIEALPHPRILVTTPVHLRFLAAEQAKFPALDLLVSATAPLSETLANSAEKTFRCPLMEIYGCAEAGQIAYRRPVQGTQWQCFEGITLWQDEQGSWAQGEQIDRATLLNDVLALCGADRFNLQGRNADVVNIAGKRTSLAYLNHHLNAIVGVADGVFILPQDRSGYVTRLSALIVAPGLTPNEVKKALRERIDPVFLPRPLHMVDALPRNANGKLTRAALDGMLAKLSPAAASSPAEITFSDQEKFLPGHFPRNPVVPGAVLLREVLCLLEERGDLPAGPFIVRAAKFLRPVRPGEAMQIRCRAVDGEYQFDCLVRDAKVLTGVIGEKR